MLLRAPAGMKSALGENPKRVYGERKQSPATRLGTAAVIRGALVDAANYLARIDAEQRKPEDDRKYVDRDLKLEALGRVLRREIPWRQHCHRADDIATALRSPTSSATSWSSTTAPRRTCLPTSLPPRTSRSSSGRCSPAAPRSSCATGRWPTPASSPSAGVTIAITTDHPVVPINFLAHQAALSVKHGLDRDTALRALTINPARIIGVDDRLGSIEPGKDADLVIWSGDPLDVLSRVTLAR